MKKITVFGAGLTIISIIFGVWFWSLGSAPVEASHGIELEAQKTKVEVRIGGQGEWQEVQGKRTVQVLDEVRTGPGGRAVVRFYGQAETRLDENTTIKIGQASQSGDVSPTVQVDIDFLGGRIWSRVLRLFDLDSSFSVRTDTAVATVRGTSFGWSWVGDSADLMVTDSAVEFMSLTDEMSFEGNASFVVSEGQVIRKRKSRGWTEPVVMGIEDASSEWFASNSEQDAAFEKEAKQRIARRLSKRSAVYGSFRNTLTTASEQLRVRLAGKNAPFLYGRHAESRLYGIYALVENGRSGLAFQAMTIFEREVREKLRSSRGADYRAPVRSALADFSLLISDAAPSSPLYRLQQRLEDLYQETTDKDSGRALYARLTGVDARLSAASRLILANALEESGVSLDAAAQGIANAERDIQEARDRLENSQLEKLQQKIRALKAREKAVRAKLSAALSGEPIPGVPPKKDEALSVPKPAPTSTEPLPGAPSTSTKPGETVTDISSTGTNPPITEKSFDSIILTIQPNPVTVGDTAEFRVTGKRSDGTSADLTSRSSFKLLGDLGTLNGPTFTAAKAGSATVEAIVTDAGTEKRATASLQVNEKVALTGIEIVPQGSTTVVPGGQVSLTVKALYSGGYSAIVTPKTGWKTSDPNVGSVSNGVFTAWVNGQGTVTITGTYTEGGVSRSSTIVFQVVPRDAAVR